MAVTTLRATRGFGTNTAGTDAMQSISPIQYLGDKVYLLDPNTNPATVLFRKAKKRVVGRLDYNMQDDVILPQFTTIASFTSGTTTQSFTVATGEGAYWAPWDLLLNKNTGVMLQVTTRTGSTDALVCAGGVDGGASTASAAGDVLLRLGNAMEENVGVPLSLTTIETTITNYIQRYSCPLRTGYAAKNAAYHYSGSDYLFQNKKKMLELTLAQDLGFLLNGKPNLATGAAGLLTPTVATGTNRIGITMGLRYFIATYADSALNRTEVDCTEAEFYEWVKDCFTYGSGEKWLVASPLLAQALMMWNLTRKQFNMKESTVIPGLTFTKIVTPHGELNVVLHKGVRGRTSSDPSWNFIIDAENIGYVYMKGLDTQIWKDVVKDGSHQYVDEIGCYCGTEFRLANTHGALKMTSFS